MLELETPQQDMDVPDGAAPDTAAPVRRLNGAQMAVIAQKLSSVFKRYEADRRVVEERWLRNLRQYLGQYDPEVESQLSTMRSKAYPKLTRVKVISVLSRIMNLMFPGNERNWELKASPSPDMDPDEIMEALQKQSAKAREAGVPFELTEETVTAAVQRLAEERASALVTLIDDQLQELGGDQTLDYVALNHKVAQSGIMYGMGLLRGPFLRQETRTSWSMDPVYARPIPVVTTVNKPMYEVLPVWDFYPDMTAKSLRQMDGYFVRLVMSRAQLRALARRSDFMAEPIKRFIQLHSTGNYSAKNFETQLRTLGASQQVNLQASDLGGRFEIIVWHGTMSGQDLAACGVEVTPDQLTDDLEAEVWLLGDHIIKAEINAWRRMGIDMQTIHAFIFDEDDSSPVGNGLPNIMRDSQMSVAAATRMLLDNASVTCGPNLEVNSALLAPGQDISAIGPYKVWDREGTGADAMAPAVRNITIDAHMPELQSVVDMFMKFADMETFVGPATGGDMERGMAEPMRTAAGASMLRGDAALPFKDIVRRFDTFTQSVITSLVHFNKKFNPHKTPKGDYNVIARGATSLIAKEVRGIQLDTLAATLTPEERLHVDERKFIEQRFAVRDLKDLLLPMDEVKRRQAAAAQQAADAAEMQRRMMEAEIRDRAADAYKSVAQAQKHAASADAATAQSAVKVLEAGMAAEQPQNPRQGAGGESGADT